MSDAAWRRAVEELRAEAHAPPRTRTLGILSIAASELRMLRGINEAQKGRIAKLESKLADLQDRQRIRAESIADFERRRSEPWPR